MQIVEFDSFEQYYENNAGNDLVIVTRRQVLNPIEPLPSFNGGTRAEKDGHMYYLVVHEGHDFPGWGGSWRGVVKGAPDAQAAYDAAKYFFQSDQLTHWSW